MLFDFEIIIFILHNISSYFYHLNLFFSFCFLLEIKHISWVFNASCFEDSTL